MGVGIYYFYHGFGLKAFEGRHIRMIYISPIDCAFKKKCQVYIPMYL